MCSLLKFKFTEKEREGQWTRRENPTEDHTFKAFEQQQSRKEKLGKGTALQAMLTVIPQYFWPLLRHCGFSFPECFISGLPVPANTAFWMKTRGQHPGEMCRPTQRYGAMLAFTTALTNAGL